MPGPDLSLLFLQPLNQIGGRYIVCGSVASILYGEPRMTNDVDLVIFLRQSDIARLHAVFPAPAFYIPPVEIIAAEMARPARGHFNVVHTATSFKADLYLAGRDDLNAWGFRHSRKITYCGEPITVAPPEYVIVRKLEYFREGGSEKHLRDIRSMLAISSNLLDYPALEEWIQRQGLAAEWTRVKAKS